MSRTVGHHTGSRKFYHHTRVGVGIDTLVSLLLPSRFQKKLMGEWGSFSDPVFRKGELNPTVNFFYTRPRDLHDYATAYGALKNRGHRCCLGARRATAHRLGAAYSIR